MCPILSIGFFCSCQDDQLLYGIFDFEKRMFLFYNRYVICSYYFVQNFRKCNFVTKLSTLIKVYNMVSFIKAKKYTKYCFYSCRKIKYTYKVYKYKTLLYLEV